MATILLGDRTPGTDFAYRLGRILTCRSCEAVWKVGKGDAFSPIVSSNVATDGCLVTCPRCGGIHTVRPDRGRFGTP